MMVNSMCQLARAMGYPDIWSNIILGVSGRVFLNEMNIWICRQSKGDCPLYSGRIT